MAIQHVNRKGDTYHLLVGKTKTGKPKYYFAKKAGGTRAEAIPDGFEVFENPENAQVLLRRAKPRLVTEEEKEAVEDAVRAKSAVPDFIVDVDGADIVVYLAETSTNEAADQIARLGGFGFPRTQADHVRWLVNHSLFTKMMRFSLVDPHERLFAVARWCFKGSIDDWFPLDGFQPLPKLLGKYAKHLGRESFYDLF